MGWPCGRLALTNRRKTCSRLEESISGQVAYTLIPQLTGKEREQLSQSGTENGKAHEAYCAGDGTGGVVPATRGTSKSAGLLHGGSCGRRELREGPCRNRGLLFEAWVVGRTASMESFAAAIEAAGTALRLEPTLAEAHASFAFATWAYDRDYARRSSTSNWRSCAIRITLAPIIGTDC